MKKFQPTLDKVFAKLDKTLGRLPAVVKNYMDKIEAGGTFGKKGSIEHSPESVALALQITEDEAADAMVTLFLNKHVVMRPNGRCTVR